MSKPIAVATRKRPIKGMCQDGKLSSQPLSDRDQHIMSKLRKLRSIGCRTSLKKMKTFLEEDRGKPHCKVVEDIKLNAFCEGYCEGFLKDCKKVLDAQAYLIAKKVLKIGFLSLDDVVSIMKLKKAQIELLQTEMA